MLRQISRNFKTCLSIHPVKSLRKMRDSMPELELYRAEEAIRLVDSIGWTNEPGPIDIASLVKAGARE